MILSQNLFKLRILEKKNSQPHWDKKKPFEDAIVNKKKKKKIELILEG